MPIATVLVLIPSRPLRASPWLGDGLGHAATGTASEVGAAGFGREWMHSGWPVAEVPQEAIPPAEAMRLDIQRGTELLTVSGERGMVANAKRQQDSSASEQEVARIEPRDTNTLDGPPVLRGSEGDRLNEGLVQEGEAVHTHSTE